MPNLALTPRELGPSGWVTAVAVDVRNLPALACELIAALDGVSVARLWVASETTHQLFLPPHLQTVPADESIGDAGRLEVQVMCDGLVVAERTINCLSPASADQAMAMLYSGRPFSARFATEFASFLQVRRWVARSDAAEHCDYTSARLTCAREACSVAWQLQRAAIAAPNAHDFLICSPYNGLGYRFSVGRCPPPHAWRASGSREIAQARRCA
jgi:hypothetical protein